MHWWVSFFKRIAQTFKEFLALDPERDSSSLRLHCKKHLYC
jgi:hypothetical protein